MEIRRRYYFRDPQDACSRALVCAFLENKSAIGFSADLERTLFMNAHYIDELLILAANVISVDYSRKLFSLDYVKYDDETLIKKIKEYFYFQNLDSNDYLNIYNLKEGNDFDKSLTVHTDFVSSKYFEEGSRSDLSWWTEYYRYDFQVFVKKGFDLSTEKVYSIRELINYSKKGYLVFVKEYPIVIHQIDDYFKMKERVKKCNNIKIDRTAFLSTIHDESHPYHSCFMTYVLNHITKDLIDNILKEIAGNYCMSLLKKPSNRSITRTYLVFKEDPFLDNLYDLTEDEIYTFEGKNIHSKKKALECILSYESSNNLIEEAKKLIIKYSKVYAFIQQFCK